MKLVLGIDLGTSYFKLGLFDHEGTLCGLGRVPVVKDDDEGWCELPVEHFWEALRTGLAQALEEADATAGNITRSPILRRPTASFYWTRTTSRSPR